MTFEQASRRAIRAAARHVEQENRKYPATFVEVPPEAWSVPSPARLSQVFRSNRFMVQVYAERDGLVRLTVHRTLLWPDGRWLEGITWDQLQEIKTALGYGDRDAVEVYPSDRDLVNVANMRHLWVLPDPIAWKWRSNEAAG